jgi:hypothetical protein
VRKEVDLKKVDETKCIEREGGAAKLDDLSAAWVSLWCQPLGHTCS